MEAEYGGQARVGGQNVVMLTGISVMGSANFLQVLLSAGAIFLASLYHTVVNWRCCWQVKFTHQQLGPKSGPPSMGKTY
jgi:hypothetical protein